ncbi:MAG: hypothetical protein N4A63_02675 [Vallitalea sp.]|jgi:FlaA1/EpsC-like NDP-sugar epimerase|nr:hypothetical protein [Vallitalea sp.]
MINAKSKFKTDIFKNRLGNSVLICYVLLYITILIVQTMNMPFDSIKKMGWFLGALIGIVIRFSIIFLYWYLMKVKYIKEDKRIDIIQLLIGSLLVMISFSPFIYFNLSFIITFIVLSIVIILNEGYYI